MVRAALTMTAIFLVAVESPAEERSLRVDIVGTVNQPTSPAIRNLIIHPERTSKCSLEMIESQNLLLSVLVLSRGTVSVQRAEVLT